MIVKIILNKNETIQDAEESLLKALDFHRSGEVHVRESFEDPAMDDLQNRLEQIHENIYKDMLDEIVQTLDEDYNGNIS